MEAPNIDSVPPAPLQLAGSGSASNDPPAPPSTTMYYDEIEKQQQLKQDKLLQQQQGRFKMRMVKLKLTHFGYIIVLVFFAVLQILGVLTFTLGFLLSRSVLPDVADSLVDPSLAMSGPPMYNKMVFLVIDALRFDFVIPVDDDKEKDYPYHNQLQVLYEMSQKHPGNSVLLKFMADPPTTTLQRLKGLTTGTLPTFIDAGSNFDGDAIDEDNWLLQLYNHNKSIAFMGDDTWKALFSSYINPDLFYPYDSLNVHDLHTVDNGVIEHLFPLLESFEQPKWDVLIGHFLGVDHVGHKYGPMHNTMKPKLNQMDTVLREVIDKIDDQTLLVVIGDHGMDATGNHGGDSRDELESTLFLYSKKPDANFQRKGAEFYPLDNLGALHRAVNQIDLVPTLSLALGLPIPHNNLGFPIDEVFGSRLEEAQKIAIRQIQKFREIAGMDDDEALNQLYDEIMVENSGHDGHDSAVHKAQKFQSIFLEHCKSMWATFDLNLIVIGILILVASLSFIITYSRLIPSVRVLTMSFEFIGSVIAMILLGLVLLFSVYIVLRPVGFSFKRCAAIGSSIGIFVGLWAPIMDRFSIPWIWHQLYDFFIYNFNGWSVLGITFIIGHSLIFASNSYVVWEDKMVHYFIQTFGWYCLAQSIIKIQNAPKRILAVMHSLTFIVMGRIISSIQLCREEQQPYCQSNFGINWWVIGGLYIVALILPRMIKKFYELSDSYHSAAPLWIGTGLTFLLYGNAMYWTLEFLDSNNNNHDVPVIESFLETLKLPNSPINDMISRLQLLSYNVNSAISVSITTGGPLIRSIKLAIARISLFITLILANYSWSRGPLCVKLSEALPPTAAVSNNYGEHEESDEEDDEVDGPTSLTTTPTNGTGNGGVIILGYQNVYGSSYFLMVLNFALPIMLVTKPLGAIAISMLLVQILTLLELFDMLNLRQNLISPTLFGLLAYQHFFATGHQATIPSIQWDVGFITTETITFPFTHLNILLNTFGSFIIICISIPLISLWRIPPSAKPITILSQIVTNVTSLITYQTVVSISSLVFAGHFRRHLMVWKIFAPRFMLSGMLLILMNVILILISVGLGTGKLLTQVNRIFGK